MNDHLHPIFRDILNDFLPKPAKPNHERLQKRCEACCGTGRFPSDDENLIALCDMCGGEGMLP